MESFHLPIASIWMVKIKIMEIMLALVLSVRQRHIISIFISQVLIIVLNPL